MTDRAPAGQRTLPFLIGVIATLAIVAGAAWAFGVWPGRETSAPQPVASTGAAPPATPVDAGAQRQAAIATAFPQGTVLTDGSERFTFDGHRLVQAPFGPVLVSEGTAADAAHVTAGRIAVAYLAPRSDGFTVVRRFPKAVEVGSFGQMSEWSVSDKFADVPVIDAEGGFTGQGYTCGIAILTALQDSGPVEIAKVPIVYDDSGAKVDEPATTVEGKFANVSPAGFNVRYTGTRNFTEHWSRRGEVFVPDAPTAVPSC